MNWIDEFKNNNISFSWSELKVGRFGFSDEKFYLQGLIDDNCVIKYTLNYLSENENEENQYLWELASLNPPNYDANEIFRLLDSVDNSKVHDLKAYYKWRWLLVNSLLQRISTKNYVNGLLEISEFWLDLESPPDMPYQFQGIKNEMTPKEFYTEQHLIQVISNHEKWLKNEKMKF